jgi:uracil-DNA glycosylase
MIINCHKCALSKTRVNVVVGRGIFTASILVMGEAPGKSEDVLGQAFIGDSGKLLDEMLKRVNINPLDCFFTNTIMCRPCDTRDGENREPLSDEIFLCMGNVQETIEKLKYIKGIIFAGSIAKRYFANRLKGLPQCHIVHPSFLLRTGGKASPHYLDAINSLKEFKNGY